MPNKTITFLRSSVMQWLLLLTVILLGLGVRLYDLTDPPLDFHATRQLRSAIIARAIYYQLLPDADPVVRDLTHELAQLEVYEPPILENVVGFADLVAGDEYAWMGRLFSSVFWIVGGIILFLIARRWVSFWAALVGLMFYLFLPMSVIMSRSFQPEPWLVMWMLLAAWALLRWSEKPTWGRAVFAGLLGGIAVLVKVVAAFFILPMLLGVVIAEGGWRRLLRSLQPWVIGAIMLGPTGLYYALFHAGRSASFLSFWTGDLFKLVFTSGFYADWLAMIKGLMGLTILLVAVAGVVLAARVPRALLVGGWVGYALYGLVFPYQYTTHEYYHLPLIPLVAMSIVAVVDLLFTAISTRHIVWKVVVLAGLLFASGYSLWVGRSMLHASDYRNEVTAWRNVAEAIPAGKSFIALTADYGMRLNYFGMRQISAAFPTTGDQNLMQLAGSDQLDYESYFAEITEGKDYFLVTAFSQLEAQPELKEILETTFVVYASGDGYVLYDLNHRLGDGD